MQPSSGSRWVRPLCARREQPLSFFSEGAFNLLEATVALAILTLALLGVLAAISNASVAERETAQMLESQAALAQVLEEIQSLPYDTVLSLNGTFVTKGNQRADIRAALDRVGLIRVQVDVTSAANPAVSSSAALLVADRN